MSGCRHYPLRPAHCERCREIANALRLERELIAELNAVEVGSPSLRELRAENQARIRRERYGDVDESGGAA